MRRSVTAMICGLIGSLFSLFWGFIFGVGGDLFNIIPTDEASKLATTFTVLGWFAFIGGIVGIVGSALSLKKARKGAICLTVATVFSAALQLYIFGKVVGGSSGSSIMTFIIIFLLPTVLLIVASVFAWLAKETEPSRSASAANQTNSGNQGLEKELSGLKEMLDKEIITEEEFAVAKKNLLEKYTK